jgi:hypothetical protein
MRILTTFMFIILTSYAFANDSIIEETTYRVPKNIHRSTASASKMIKCNFTLTSTTNKYLKLSPILVNIKDSSKGVNRQGRSIGSVEQPIKYVISKKIVFPGKDIRFQVSAKGRDSIEISFAGVKSKKSKNHLKGVYHLKNPMPFSKVNMLAGAFHGAISMMPKGTELVDSIAYNCKIN